MSQRESVKISQDLNSQEIFPTFTHNFVITHLKVLKLADN